MNKTTGLAAIHADWFVDGLMVDVATIDHYDIVVNWVVIVSSTVQSPKDVIGRIDNVSVSPVRHSCV